MIFDGEGIWIGKLVFLIGGDFERVRIVIFGRACYLKSFIIFLLSMYIYMNIINNYLFVLFLYDIIIMI